ncbi:hypothetical protein D7Y50_12830 [Stenotrophomonas maltophilia]|uniref:hypothetical protein n=2 Tax=Stenotrophomonas TaxID=40323 RepID=UPI0015DDFB46|nr:hypothetical protein [Stenotrophomonas maltophilia]MBA0234574.1 hypothetical protein [Stenotrophomonas maltophilia]MBA0269048.1 hypothetical protein [Stenotrophomonas maltophilia]
MLERPLLTMGNGLFVLASNKEFGVESVAIWKPLLQQMLRGQPPEPAARLLQRLAKSPEAKALGGFDYKRMGFPRFKNFLDACSDVLDQHISAHGDMLVSLRGTTVDARSEAVRPAPSSIRSDVWIAFSNPDPNRIRFINRTTGEVMHHVLAAGETVDGIRPGQDWVQIEPVAADVQASWMREFAAQTEGVNPEDHAVLRQSYRTYASAIFAKELGPLGKQWTKFRTAKMVEAIQKWSARVNIALATLTPAATNRLEATAVETPKLEAVTSGLSARARALKLMDALTDEEISSTLVPLMASIIMVKAQR